MLTPPGPTSSPTMISTMPSTMLRRSSMTMPATTRMTAMIQRIVGSMTASSTGPAPAGTCEDCIDLEVAPRLERSAAEARVAVLQQRDAPLVLVGLADALGGTGQQRHAAQEAPVGLVRPRHRAVTLPAVAAQGVQAAVVARARVRVGRDRVTEQPLR